MRAMLNEVIERYPGALNATFILICFCGLFTLWTVLVFRPQAKRALERGSRLPLDLEEK